MQQRTGSIDPDGLWIIELTVMPLRRLLCSHQTLTSRYSSPQQQAQCAAAGRNIRLTCWQ